MILTVTMNPSIDTRYQLDKLIIDDVNRVTPKDAAARRQRESRAAAAGRTTCSRPACLAVTWVAYMAELMDADGVKNDFVPTRR